MNSGNWCFIWSGENYNNSVGSKLCLPIVVIKDGAICCYATFMIHSDSVDTSTTNEIFFGEQFGLVTKPRRTQDPSGDWLMTTPPSSPCSNNEYDVIYWIHIRIFHKIICFFITKHWTDKIKGKSIGVNINQVSSMSPSDRPEGAAAPLQQ